MSMNVCENQDKFNVAIQKAINKNNEDALNSMGPWLYVYVLLGLIFFVWAIMLAMKVPQGSQRVLHLVLAILVSPVYVISHYLGEMKK